MSKPVEYRKLSPREHELTLDKSRIIAVFVEVEGRTALADGQYGLMVNGETYPTREEKAALIRAARSLPTSD